MSEITYKVKFADPSTETGVATQETVFAELKLNNLKAFDLTTMTTNKDAINQAHDKAVRVLAELAGFWDEHNNLAYRVDAWKGDKHCCRVGFITKEHEGMTMPEFDEKIMKHQCEMLDIYGFKKKGGKND